MTTTVLTPPSKSTVKYQQNQPNQLDILFGMYVYKRSIFTDKNQILLPVGNTAEQTLCLFNEGDTTGEVQTLAEAQAREEPSENHEQAHLCHSSAASTGTPALPLTAVRLLHKQQYKRLGRNSTEATLTE